jgi:F-type H+-transporting ATPase subunit alpha
MLLALTAGLFDTVPLARMAEAQRAVQDAAAKLDGSLRERLVGANKLSDEDRKAVTDSAGAVLKTFLPAPEVKPAAKVAA